jgi:hypothetical protein
MDFSEFMEHAASFAPPSSSRDGGGGESLAYTTRDADQPCSLLVAPGTETVQFEQMQIPTEATLVTYYAGTQRGDRVTVTAGPGLVGAVFRVVGIGTQPGLEFIGIDTLYTIKLAGWQ